MKSDATSVRTGPSIRRATVTLPILSVLAAVAAAQEPAKVPRPLPVMSDVKTPAPPPPMNVTASQRALPEGLQHPQPKPPKTTTVAQPDASPFDFSHVMFDQPGDGATWARGSTYKASFDAQGATYIPFLGSSAPQNYPVRVRLESARVGGVPLSLSSNGVSQSGDDVVLDRGTLREVWHLTPDSAEQSFVLAARPAASGTLELHLALETELQTRVTSQGFELANERGGVTISETVVVDALGARTHVESRIADGVLSIDVPAEVLASARYPLAVDPVYATNALDTSTTFTRSPDISNSSTGGTWGTAYEFHYSQTDYDVWTQDVYYGVPQTGGVWADVTTYLWLEPRIAFNAFNGTYLVVANVRPSPGNPYQVWGRARIVGTSSQFVQKVIQNASLGSLSHVDVGGDPSLFPPTYFMVVWTREATVSDWDVHGRLVDADGTPLGTAPIFIDNTTAFDLYPAISKTDGRAPSTTQEWNVTWMRLQGTEDIWGAQIHWDGTISTSPFLIAHSGLNDQFPSASSLLDDPSGLPRPWMVTFDRPLGDYDIIADALVGSTVLGELNLSVTEGIDIYEDQTHPAVDSDGQRFVVAYSETYNGSVTDTDLYAATLHLTGSTLTVDEAHQNLDFSSLSTDDAQIASGMTDSDQGFPYYGIVWSTYYGSTSNVHVGAYLEPGTVESFCAGDGSWGNCPCGNSGGPTVGCANSVTNGAGLGGSGTNFVSADTFSLYAYDMPATASCLFFQGASPATVGVAFGDGLRCTSGSTIRIGNKTAVNGSASYPEPGDQPLSVKGGVPAEGGVRAYQVWYRNSGSFCTPSPFNLTSAVRVLWLR